MPWVRYRFPLLTAAFLDALGVVILTELNQAFNLRAGPHETWVVLGLVLIYCSLGWLFGSYTLLRFKSLSLQQLVARLGSTTLGSFTAAVLLSYLFKIHLSTDLFFRSNLIPLFLLLSLWSSLVRLLIRRSQSKDQKKRWRIVAQSEEIPYLEKELVEHLPRSRFPEITEATDEHSMSISSDSYYIALSSGVMNDANLKKVCQDAVNRGQPVFSIIEMAEQELQRIPTQWIGNEWIFFSTNIDGQHTNLKKQFKRYADVLVSALILILLAPLILLLMILVKLQDGGPMLYRQRRSGLHGKQFDILKIRTMRVNAEFKRAQWAKKNDDRVTPIGYWLRRTRVDELPQLINVLLGEMSLIGPRPERPELEESLEKIIPNYTLRYWMRPGLSGWAQVNMFYASSVEDSELKLSYDLFYLRNSSVWLDLLILFKTIKIILKVAGR